MKTRTHYRHFESGWGKALVARRYDALTGVWFIGQKYQAVVAPDWHAAAGADDLLDRFVRQWAQYEAGQRQRFDLPLAPAGTPFQQEVWRALQAIPYACTTSYGVIAADIGRPQAVRAVGAAVGRNPLSVVIPCHRVLGRSGSLTGYAGGLERKQSLLALEQSVARAAGRPATLAAGGACA